MRTILITGSSRGIGKATATLAHQQGYKVIVHGRTDSEELEEIHKTLEGSEKVSFDVSDKDATHAAIRQLLDKVGTIDVLVNNAGMGSAGIKDVAEIDDEKAITEYKNNVLGTLHCIQSVLPSMLQHESGTIISVSSIKGHDYLTTLSSLPYGIAKAGILSISKSLAKAYPQIRFNTVSPGYTQTDMASKWSPQTFDMIKDNTLAGRVGLPEEIAAAIMFLASDAASYISGVDLMVDGGFAIKVSKVMKTKSGKDVFPIGIGTWGISGTIDPNVSSKYGSNVPMYGNEDREIEALRYSMEKGQNHFDCAELYSAFYADEVVGRAIAGQLREDLFIADKLWKTSVGKGKARATVEQMLEKFGTDYIDLLYIHAPWEDAPWREAIPQIDELIDAGLVRYFGVSNFTIEQMEEVRKVAKHPLAANQMHYNVLYRDEVNQTFLDYCQQHNIALVAYRPVERQEVNHDATLQEIATAHDATPAQVALAWLLAKGALPIPKATQQAHIDENIKALELKLTGDELIQLDNL